MTFVTINGDSLLVRHGRHVLVPGPDERCSSSLQMHHGSGSWSAQLDVMGDQDEDPAGGEQSSESIVQDPLGSVGVNGREHVIQKQSVRSTVYRTREAHSGLLSAAQDDAPLANLCLIAVLKDGQVRLQPARLDCGCVSVCVVWESEEDAGVRMPTESAFCETETEKANKLENTHFSRMLPFRSHADCGT